MLDDLTLVHWLTLHGLITAATVLIYVINSHVMRQRRSPTAAIAWMLFILLMPYLALPAFLLFGSRKLARPLPSPRVDRPALPDSAAWAIETIMALDQAAPAEYSDLNLHRNGAAARDALLATIERRQASIDVCTFIIGRDSLGNTVLEHLCRKAAEGLRVRLLLDGMGPPDDGRSRLEAAWSRQAARWRCSCRRCTRPEGPHQPADHRKLLIADAALALRPAVVRRAQPGIGNFEGRPGQAPWRDLSIDLRGPLLLQATACSNVTGSSPQGHRGALACRYRQGRRERRFRWTGRNSSHPDPTRLTTPSTRCWSPRPTGRAATSRLSQPYFVPEPSLLMALCLAAKRGVAWICCCLRSRTTACRTWHARARCVRWRRPERASGWRRT